MTRYWVEKSASKNHTCLVGWTRTTRRCSSRLPSSFHWARNRMVSLEKPVDAGASTSPTWGSAPAGSRVASQRARVLAVSFGSRCTISGMADQPRTRTGATVGAPVTWRIVEFVVDLEKVTVLLHTPSDTERFAVRVV